MCLGEAKASAVRGFLSPAWHVQHAATKTGDDLCSRRLREAFLSYPFVGTSTLSTIANSGVCYARCNAAPSCMLEGLKLAETDSHSPGSCPPIMPEGAARPPSTLRNDFLHPIDSMRTQLPQGPCSRVAGRPFTAMNAWIDGISPPRIKLLSLTVMNAARA